MSDQHSATENETPANPQEWTDLLKLIVEKENKSVWLYIASSEQFIHLFVIKDNNQISTRQIDVIDCLGVKRSVTRVTEVLCNEIYKNIPCLPAEQPEDRGWRTPNVLPQRIRRPFQDNMLTMFRPIIEDEKDRHKKVTLADCYKLIIAPVADLLDKTEIIIVPDRLFAKVPFAALQDESGKCLSESFRIRIFPSLTALKLIHETTPADYHSETGALIVGNPAVGEVMYRGSLRRISRLPFANEEAQMIGELLGTQPLLGKEATKETILQKITSVSLIHFAAHGNAERGEIAVAPPPLMDRTPEEEDYILTVLDISQVRLRAKLVVLSCCHSTRRRIDSEGIIGTARAFIVSGARSVLVALCPIEDNATKQFLSRFYGNLARGESASESLNETMKWMRENGFPKDRQWAPFMLVGDNVTLDFQKLRAESLEAQPHVSDSDHV